METEIVETLLDVDTTEKKICNNNPDRVEIIFSNLTANDVIVGLDNKVSTTRGISVDVLGGLIAFRTSEDGKLPTHEYHAVASADNTAVLMIEVIKKNGGA